MEQLVDKVEIVFEKESAIFHDGDHVTGLVLINNNDDIAYKSIRVELCGTAIVFWGDVEERGIEKLDDLDDIQGDCNKEKYIQRVVLLEQEDGGDVKDLILEPGEHCLPFCCRLLPDLPSSFEGQHGCVRYVAKAIIEQTPPSASAETAAETTTTTTTTTTKSDVVVARRSFTMAPGLNLCFLPEAIAKIEICKYRELGMCCTEGSVTFDWTIEKSGFVCGEDVWIRGSVQNDSRHTVACSTITFYMVVDYKANKRRKQERKKLAGLEKGPTHKDDITVWNDSIHIPNIPPTGLNRCRLIDVKYELEFRAVIEGSSPPIVVTKDIYIGTVPLCLRETRSCTTVGPLVSRHYVTASLPTSYDELATFDDNDDNASYNSRPSAVSRLSLVDFVAATAVQAHLPGTGPSAPAMSAVLHAPPPEGPPPYDARPPPFAPGHDDGAVDRQASSTDPQILQPPPCNPAFADVPTSQNGDQQQTFPDK